MSIELGRGVKRGEQFENDDMSSNAIFNFGNEDGQYELTGTPPIRTRYDARKLDGALRKEASMRRATETARASDALKRTVNGVKQRAVSDGLPKPQADSDISQIAADFDRPTATLTFRNTRFAGSRQPPANQPAHPTRFTATHGLQSAESTPLRATNVNATVQSATYTANQSFMLPDLPNITELVSGVRKDGTPVVNRGIKSRSRFTSGSYRSQPQAYHPIDGLPLPDDERAIFSSLQVLKDRISQLETENDEAHKRAEKYEAHIGNLQHQLGGSSRSQAAVMESDDDTTGQANPRNEKGKLEATLKTLQDRFDRSERKISMAEIAVKRVVKERDALIAQIGAAYFDIEQLTKENGDLRQSHDGLQVEAENLKQEVDVLKSEKTKLRAQLKRTYPQQGMSAQDLQKEPSAKSRSKKPSVLAQDQQDKQGVSQQTRESLRKSDSPVRSRKETASVALDQYSQPRKLRDHLDNNTALDIASKIEREVQKHREKAAGASRSRGDGEREVRTRSKSRQREASANTNRSSSLPKQMISKAADVDISESESTTELLPTQQSLNSTRKSRSNGPATRTIQTNQDTRDLTMLSALDENLVANLRKKLEEEHRAKRAQRRTSAPVQGATEQASHSQAPPFYRKSSLKDVTAGIDARTSELNDLGDFSADIYKATKSVRVQSPHTSDGAAPPQQWDSEIGDTSIMSNTSRRRRRAASAEGITSAFILPDITVRDTFSLPASDGKSCIQHDTADCTVCASNDKAPTIPEPVAVGDRANAADITDATIRPAQPPAIALATVIKHLEDEITHLKLQREAYNARYNRHDPALFKSRRLRLKTKLDLLTAEIEKRSDQVYALYDVLEGQGEEQSRHSEAGNHLDRAITDEEVEETLLSVGIDPVELSGRVGRSAPMALDGVDEFSDGSDDLPWEGLSDYQSDQDA